MLRAGRLLFLCAYAAACGPGADLPLRSATSVAANDAEGGATCLEVTSSDLDFGIIEGGGCSERAWVTISNSCAIPVRVRRVEALPAGGSFELVGAPAIPAEGLAIAPGGAMDVWIKFLPDAGGPALSELSVEVDHAVDWSRSWTLIGQGQEAVAIVDEWRAPEQLGADVLFVIDNGPGFERHLLSFGLNMKSVGRYLPIVPSSNQIAIATTGGTASSMPGELLASASGSRIFHSTDPAFEAEFNSAIQSIAPTEPALGIFDAALNALGAAKAEGLLRHPNSTAINLISHRTDTSSLNAYDFIATARWEAEERHPYGLTVNAIGGYSAGCEADDGSLWMATALTNGVRDDICVPDWGKSLEGSSHGWWGQARWPLSRVPDLSRAPLDVSIEGMLIPSRDTRGSTIWTYDAILRAVVFEPMYAPEPGQTIRATYLPFCGQ